MKPIRAFRRLLFRLEVWLGLAWARFCTKFLPFRFWRAALGPIGEEPDAHAHARLSEAQLKQARDSGRIIARVAGRAWFEAVCLPQAMCGRWVLARRGIPSRVVIGSGHGDEEEGPLFHAWLMVGECVVTGAAERDAFLAFRRSGAVQDAG